MKKKLLIFLGALIVMISLFNTISTKTDCAQNSEKVTLIYVHGVDEPSIEEFYKEVAGLQKHFVGKNLGNYIIDKDYKKVYWGNLPIKDDAFKLNSEGLKAMNMEHNIWQAKKTTEPKLALLFNPINKFFLVGDMGSSSNAVFFRNFINAYVYQIIWAANDINNKQRLFDLIEKKVSEVNGKYVLVCHSLGSALSIKFIKERLIPDRKDGSKNKHLSDNFVGIITSGDVNNIFQSKSWSQDLQPGDYDYNKNNLIKYFIENNKFWISYSHRNDLFASKPPPTVTSHNDDGPGFIVAKTKKAYPCEGFINFITFWDRSNGMYFSHLYMFNKPKSFVNGVLKIFNQELKRKKSLKKD